tara:strand:+ start:256 stop:1095 length:840 start_codon:yes stop_codon:yes gene_type:complete
MKINHSLIKIFNTVIPNNILSYKYFRILNFHHIREEYFENIKTILLSLKNDHEFINPKNFYLMENKDFIKKKKCIMITLDDGYYSQRNFAEKVLDELDIKAIFFVIPNFVNKNNLESSKQFVKKNILNTINLKNFDINMRNMTIADLQLLLKNGHEIGLHSLNHIKLSNISSQNFLEEEIYGNLDKMQKMLGTKINSFAYPFGDIKSISPEALSIIQKYYKFIFSGIRGNNSSRSFKKIYWRDAIDDNSPLDLFEGLLRGFSDFYYYIDRKKITWMLNR